MVTKIIVEFQNGIIINIETKQKYTYEELKKMKTNGIEIWNRVGEGFEFKLALN